MGRRWRPPKGEEDPCASSSSRLRRSPPRPRLPTSSIRPGCRSATASCRRARRPAPSGPVTRTRAPAALRSTGRGSTRPTAPSTSPARLSSTARCRGRTACRSPPRATSASSPGTICPTIRPAPSRSRVRTMPTATTATRIPSGSSRCGSRCRSTRSSPGSRRARPVRSACSSPVRCCSMRSMRRAAMRSLMRPRIPARVTRRRAASTTTTTPASACSRSSIRAPVRRISSATPSTASASTVRAMRTATRCPRPISTPATGAPARWNGTARR